MPGCAQLLDNGARSALRPSITVFLTRSRKRSGAGSGLNARRGQRRTCRHAATLRARWSTPARLREHCGQFERPPRLYRIGTQTRGCSDASRFTGGACSNGLIKRVSPFAGPMVNAETIRRQRAGGLVPPGTNIHKNRDWTGAHPPLSSAVANLQCRAESGFGLRCALCRKPLCSIPWTRCSGRFASATQACSAIRLARAGCFVATQILIGRSLRACGERISLIATADRMLCFQS
jgi:hypothetical protein